MPAPTNQTPETAIDITSLPYTVTQNVHDAGTTYSVWYKYTAVSGDDVIGVWGFGALAGYIPTTSVYIDVGTTVYKGIANYPERPIQFSVTAGETYYFIFVTNSPTFSPASLDVLVQRFTPSGAPVGSIFINDASSEDHLAAIVSSTTGVPLDYVSPFPGGEQITSLTNGVMFLQDTDSVDYKLYAPTYTLIASVAVYNICIGSNRTTQFYTGHTASSGTPGLIQTISQAGAIGATTWDVGGGVSTIAPSRDDTILYFADGTSGATVQRWDLVNDIALSNLAAGVGGYRVNGLLVLGDGTILVIYREVAATDVYIVRYSAAGATLNTYSTPLDASVGADTHITYALDDPTSFWVWIKITGDESRFLNLNTSTGATIASVDGHHFSSGSYDGSNTATPVTYFGHSESCQFLVTTTGITPPVSYTTEDLVPRRLRRATHLSHEQLWSFYQMFQLDMETGVGLTTGQGEDPQVMLRWSDDGGHTWSHEQWVSAGRLGKYAHRAIWRRLGRSRDRVFEITYSEPTKCNLVGAFVDVEGGTS